MIYMNVARKWLFRIGAHAATENSQVNIAPLPVVMQ